MKLETIRSRYQADQSKFARLAEHAEWLLRKQCREHRIACRIESRAKELQSVLKKVLFQDSQYKSLIDKAGVRVILFHSDQAANLDAAVQAVCEVHKRIDLAEKLRAAEFGYAGKHYYVSLLPECLDESTKDLTGLKFELQVHTQAQNLWAAISHDLLYKSNIENVRAMRAISRIAAVLEVVDLEVVRVRDLVNADESSVARRILSVLEPAYLLLATERFNRAVSLQVLPAIEWMILKEDIDRWVADFELFVSENDRRLRKIFVKYQNDSRNPLMTQPESLLILYAQDRDPYKVADEWPEGIESSILASFQGIWPKS